MSNYDQMNTVSTTHSSLQGNNSNYRKAFNPTTENFGGGK